MQVPSIAWRCKFSICKMLAISYSFLAVLGIAPSLPISKTRVLETNTIPQFSAILYSPSKTSVAPS